MIRKKDNIVTKVLSKFTKRSEVGISKYCTTLEDNTDGYTIFLNHLQEELMDATLYVEKLKQIEEDKNKVATKLFYAIMNIQDESPAPCDVEALFIAAGFEIDTLPI